MRVYLSSPGSQLQADHCRGQSVLLSFGVYRSQPWIQNYAPSFSHVLIDSGAFSELNSGKAIDIHEFAEWAQSYPYADAVAALDDISGDWQRGLRNWEAYPWMFPTFHDTDPWEALDAILEKSPKWIGLGMKPPRTSQGWLAECLERIPPDIHIHGWALRAFSHCHRINSLDSTNWFRDSWQVSKSFPWLTPGETLEIIVKRYERESRLVKKPQTDSKQGTLAL